MEFNTYSNGKKTIRATSVMYEMLYKAEGFKPVKASDVNVNKGTSSCGDTAKNSSTETVGGDKKQGNPILDGEIGI